MTPPAIAGRVANRRLNHAPPRARASKARRALLLFTLAGAAALTANCATTPEVRPPPVVLAERCTSGPFCLTGEVDDQYATAVEGVRCVGLGVSGQSPVGATDKRGVFFLDGLTTLPPQVRFEKPGFVSQTVPVLATAAGASARVYVILHHISQSECTCEPAALISGREPCPAETCGESHYDPIQESPPATPPPD